MNLCERVVDEVDNTPCNEEATHQVKVKGRAGPVLVHLCRKHKAEHDETFAKLRVTGK